MEKAEVRPESAEREGNHVEERTVQLGFVERPDDLAKLSDFAYLPDKVGGKPTWLVPTGVPSSADVQCSRCEKAMPLLMQIYAPFKELDHTYHRMVYVFCCKNGSCHASLPLGSFKVFRCQLPHDNPYYVDKSEEEIEEDPDAAQYTYHLPEKVFFCAECGMSAPKRCSACKSVHYCSVDHQREHWSRGHKEECDRLRARAEEHGSAKSGMAQSPNLFDEWEIITEEEPSDDEDDDVDVNSEAYKKKLSRKYKELKQLNTMRAKTQVREPGALPEDFPVPEDADEEGSVDDSFIAFQHRIKRAPNQILRYARWAGAKPLWVCDKQQATPTDVPVCPDCQTPRKFEFQILPQLLHYMEVEKVEREGLEKALNWGTVVIYSCPNSCPRTADSGAPKSATYSEEFAWRQNMD